MTASVFIGTSVDGFIARPNGELDFLPEGGEPHGYDEFIASVDAIVIGRKTFETVLAFQAWPYGDKRVVVLSSRPVDFSAVRGGVVEQMAGPPAEIVSQLAARGIKHLYIDSRVSARGGYSTADYHARAGPHWRGSSFVWQCAARHSAAPCGDAALCERLGAE